MGKYFLRNARDDGVMHLVRVAKFGSNRKRMGGFFEHSALLFLPTSLFGPKKGMYRRGLSNQTSLPKQYVSLSYDRGGPLFSADINQNKLPG